MNNIHKFLQFKPTKEINSTINFLDLSIIRKHNELVMNIYRKPTTIDTTMHYNSNHPMEHKLAAYRFLQNRVHQLPIRQEYKEQEMNTLYQTAKKNGYTKTTDKLSTQIINKNQNKTQSNPQTQKN
jgi:hypothetical protein